MDRCRFALIGTGYRAGYFARIAAQVPERFEIVGVLGRGSARSQAFAELHGLRLCGDLDELLAFKPAFVVLCVSRGQATGLISELMRRGIPLLCETPPGESQAELVALWEEAQARKALIDVAEQYFLQPLYAAWYEAIRQGLIGEVQNISLSALHGYHAVSIIRRFLGVNMAACRLQGKAYTFQALRTDSREGPLFDGEIAPYTRDRISFEFDGGKVAFHDFTSLQYHSFIRARQLNVQGLRGEIDDLSIRYLRDDNVPMALSLTRLDRGPYTGKGWSHHGMMLGERLLYQSPFPGARLNDDEIAIASCLAGMQRYIETDEPFYGLREALQDSYLSLLMDEALSNPGRTIASERMPWAEA